MSAVGCKVPLVSRRVWPRPAALVAITLLSAAGPRDATTGALPSAPSFAVVEQIVSSRCSMCHAVEPLWPGIATAPKAVLLDDEDHIRRNARLIGRVAAWSSAMPPGNITDITPQERATLAAWIEGGR